MIIVIIIITTYYNFLISSSKLSFRDFFYDVFLKKTFLQVNMKVNWQWNNNKCKYINKIQNKICIIISVMCIMY